jgi:hypothetical protein
MVRLTEIVAEEDERKKPYYDLSTILPGVYVHFHQPAKSSRPFRHQPRYFTNMFPLYSLFISSFSSISSAFSFA